MTAAPGAAETISQPSGAPFSGPFAALLMPAGALADRLGRRRMLIIGLSIFTFASFLCGAAPNLATLNGARALQAVGAALQLTSSLAVGGHGFEAHDSDRVYAI